MWLVLTVYIQMLYSAIGINYFHEDSQTFGSNIRLKNAQLEFPCIYKYNVVSHIRLF